MKALTVNLFLKENQWVSDAVASKPGVDSPDVQIHVEISRNGHKLIRDHGMLKFEQRIQAKLSPINHQDSGWKVRPVTEEVWGPCDPEVKQKLPEVLSRIDDYPNYRLLIDVSPDLSCFQGHFPDRPILAGVTQLHWAVCASSNLYGYREVPAGIKRLKFMNTVSPPNVLELLLSKKCENEVQFEFSSLGHTHSQGCLVFDRGAEC